MEIEIKRISIQTIKPSSPTPKPLQKYLLSSIDQSSPPIFTPSVYFYESNPKITNSEISKQLKKSLSDVLSRFYPLAGRLVGNHYVDCNDAGAPFSKAEANCLLSQVLPDPDNDVMAKFLPDYKPEEPQDLCLAVQATYFRCGGVAIGYLISHKVTDGLSGVMFVNAWAAAARNSDFGGDLVPEFDAVASFPPLQDTSVIDPNGSITKEGLASRIITFPAAKIAALRKRYAASGDGRLPSPVEAVSAYIWLHYLSATGVRSDSNKIYAITHAVNIRGRVKPPLSKYHFGNIIGSSIVLPAAGDGGAEVVQKIRDAVRAVDGGRVASPNMGEGALNEMIVFMCFSSLCGVPMYEADFGWGKPAWFGLGRLPYKNMVFITDTKSGGGMQAFVNLTKQDMLKFEAHLEFQMLKSNL